MFRETSPVEGGGQASATRVKKRVRAARVMATATATATATWVAWKRAMGRVAREVATATRVAGGKEGNEDEEGNGDGDVGGG
jgi:hypothetical protein